MIHAMNGLFGKLYTGLSDEDKTRWSLVKSTLGNIRFGGRGELNYPSFDKVQHFFGGASFNSKYIANIVGTGIELKDAFTRFYTEYITKDRKNHHVGYDIHDMEWTWAGGGFSSAVTSQSAKGIDRIIEKFANGMLVLSDIYQSVMPNKDPSPEYKDSKTIDHAEYSFPSPVSYPAKAHFINLQIEKMEKKINESAK